MTRLVLVLMALCALLLASTPRSAADINDSPVSMGEDVSVRRLSGAPQAVAISPDSTRPAQDGGRYGGAPFIALDQEAGDTKVGGAGSGFQPVPSADLPDSVSLDLADFAILPPLRPLASDCRLPCYGTARVGPASWYNAGPGYYAAIPGYLGGVVSVVVCTFPDGQANCHTFPVVDVCGCYRHEKRERVVDLSPAAYRLFAPLSSGIVMVQVTVLR